MKKPFRRITFWSWDKCLRLSGHLSDLAADFNLKFKRNALNEQKNGIMQQTFRLSYWKTYPRKLLMPPSL